MLQQHYPKRDEANQLLFWFQLQLKLASVITNLFVSLESPDEMADRLPALDFSKEDCDDGIWTKVFSVSATPALNQKWKETVTRSKLLDYLKIDPNNVVSWLIKIFISRFVVIRQDKREIINETYIGSNTIMIKSRTDCERPCFY